MQNLSECCNTSKISRFNKEDSAKSIIAEKVNDSTFKKPQYSPVVDISDDGWLLVFQLVNISQRIKMATVCVRWKKLVSISLKSGACSLSYVQDVLGLLPPNVYYYSSDSQLKECHSFLKLLILPLCKFHLRRLDLTRARADILFTALDQAQYCPSLQHIRISKMDFSDNSHLSALAEKLPRLRSLDLSDSYINVHAFRSAMASLQSLESLNLSRGMFYGYSVTNSTGIGFDQVPQSLKQVNVLYCFALTIADVQTLARRCPELESVRIASSSLYFFSRTDPPIIDLMENCKILKRLFIIDPLPGYHTSKSWPMPSSRLFGALSQLSLLVELNVSDQTFLTDETFRVLGKHCHLLQVISCKRTGITDNAICYLSPCQHLKNINISACPDITDSGLIQLSINHSKLKTVTAHRCSGATSRGVSQLSACPSLMVLDISLSTHLTADKLLPALESRAQSRQHTPPVQVVIWAYETFGGNRNMDKDFVEQFNKKNYLKVRLCTHKQTQVEYR